MARVPFRLEPLFRVRRLEEDRKRSAFLGAVRRCREKEQAIQQLTGRREEAKSLARQRQEGTVEIEELLRARRYLNVLFQRISEKREELKAMRPALGGARGAHRRGAQQRRGVAKLA